MVLVLSIKVLHSIHSIQINCISSLFCLSYTVLSWFNSYLPDNWRSLCIDGSSSVEIRLQFGDPQRFVIGLFKIKMYNSPFTQFGLVDVNDHYYTSMMIKNMSLSHWNLIKFKVSKHDAIIIYFKSSHKPAAVPLSIGDASILRYIDYKSEIENYF